MYICIYYIIYKEAGGIMLQSSSPEATVTYLPPKPETQRNPKAPEETRSNPETRNPKPGTRNPEPGTRNPKRSKSETQNPEP